MSELPVCTCATNNDARNADLINYHARGCRRRVAYEQQVAAVAVPKTTTGAPRVVCTKCPAVATVHMFLQRQNSTVMWVECHGEHKWAESYSPYQSGGDDLLFHKINTEPRATMIGTYIEDAEKSEGTAKMIAARDTFIQAAKYSIPPDDLHELYAQAERMMLFWSERVQTLKGRMK